MLAKDRSRSLHSRQWCSQTARAGFGPCESKRPTRSHARHRSDLLRSVTRSDQTARAIRSRILSPRGGVNVYTPERWIRSFLGRGALDRFERHHGRSRPTRHRIQERSGGFFLDRCPLSEKPDMQQSPGCTAILLIAHGSRQQSANDDLRELAVRLAGQGIYSIVEPCFLELAEPGLIAGGDRCARLGATRVLMIPYFLSAGVHLRRDLTAACDELNRRHPGVAFYLGSPLGPHPLLDQLVAERIRELDPHSR